MAKVRIAVTGHRGQVARSLVERANGTDLDVITLARPVLDLADLRTVDAAMRATAADIVVNAAAYTDVNKAESEPELADLINARAPGILAASAARRGIPIIHLSTDYVFDGQKTAPYCEADPVNSLGAYGRSKAEGENAVASAHSHHVILRTCWLYSPYSRNFVRTMLDLAKRQQEIKVVSDQFGNPTAAADIADGVLTVARNLVESQHGNLYGIFHMASAGTASWAEFAAEIFSIAAARGAPSAQVVPISTAEYPTPARRPLNSSLDCTKIAKLHGILLPEWHASLGACIDRLLEPTP